MKKILFVFLVVVSAAALIFRFFSEPVLTKLGFQTKAGLQVISEPAGANVYLDNVQVGLTPFHSENLEAGDYQIKLTAKDLVWQGRVKLNTGTLSVVNRELKKEASASSGETLSLSVGRGVAITSLPTGADITIDGTDVGVTPLFIPDLAVGEHIFLFAEKGYLTRSIRAFLPENLTLNIAVDLAMQEMEAVSSAPSLPMVTVKTTPTGFLRVREKASANSVEVGRVNSGDKLVLLDEVPGWVKIRLPGGGEGYVSSSYTQKN